MLGLIVCKQVSYFNWFVFITKSNQLNQCGISCDASKKYEILIWSDSTETSCVKNFTTHFHQYIRFQGLRFRGCIKVTWQNIESHIAWL